MGDWGSTCRGGFGCWAISRCDATTSGASYHCNDDFTEACESIASRVLGALGVVEWSLKLARERGTRLVEARALYLVSRLPGSPEEAVLESKKLLAEVGAAQADIVPEETRLALSVRSHLSRKLVEHLPLPG